MKHSKMAVIILSCVAAVACYGQTSDTKPDNTKVNERDRTGAYRFWLQTVRPSQLAKEVVAADQQKVNGTDRDLTKKIRQSVVADKSLSTYAYNIKIISHNGAVTLKGPVKSDDEKRAVVAKAAAVAGSADKVTDEISVKQ